MDLNYENFKYGRHNLKKIPLTEKDKEFYLDEDFYFKNKNFDKPVYYKCNNQTEKELENKLRKKYSK